MGRQQHSPSDENRRTVEAMAGYGVPQEDIASVLGIDAKTLRLHYREELDTAAIRANAKVAQTLFRQATEGGNTAAAIFWLKARAGWREKLEVESTGKNGGPIESTTTIKVVYACNDDPADAG